MYIYTIGECINGVGDMYEHIIFANANLRSIRACLKAIDAHLAEDPELAQQILDNLTQRLENLSNTRYELEEKRARETYANVARILKEPSYKETK